jgi:hypothetical protein
MAAQSIFLDIPAAGTEVHVQNAKNSNQALSCSAMREYAYMETMGKTIAA